MCQRTTVVSPLPVKLAKITVIVTFFFFAECAAGSCLSYGHACWGAHGKRNGGGHTRTQEPPTVNKDTQWFLAKLMQSPIDLRYVSDRDMEIPTNQQLFSDAQIEAELIKGQDDYRSMQDGYFTDDNVLTDDMYPIQRTHSRRMRSTKALEKRSKRMI